ncbi:MAG: carboxypeptidase M32, partial [Planctomycetes bacterium]|nr:carboxypeptidase M32 [Planctomycetota bacterium]
MPAAYDQLLAHHREVFLLGSTSALLGWDQETYMPAGAGDVRADQLALLARLQHERVTDPRVAEWLAACEGDAQVMADPDRIANVRGLRRDHDRATRLPAALVAEIAATE